MSDLQLVEEIVEDNTGSRELTASWIHGVQCDVENLLAGLDDHEDIPDEFIAALRAVADFKVRL